MILIKCCATCDYCYEAGKEIRCVNDNSDFYGCKISPEGECTEWRNEVAESN